MTIGLFELIVFLSIQTILFVGWSVFIYKAEMGKQKIYKRLQQDVSKQVRDVKHTTIDLLGENDLTEENLNYPENNKDLGSLVRDQGSEKDYNEYVNKLIEVTKYLYKNYKFLKQDPTEDDFTSGYFMVLQFNQEEFPDAYGYLFKLATDKSLDTQKINEKFVKELVAGNVLPLGDVTIDEEGSGVTPILTATNVRVNITFETPEYHEKKEEALEKRQKELEEKNAKAQETAKKKDDAVKQIQVSTTLLSQLNDEIAEKHELSDLVEKTKQMVGLI